MQPEGHHVALRYEPIDKAGCQAKVKRFSKRGIDKQIGVSRKVPGKVLGEAVRHSEKDKSRLEISEMSNSLIKFLLSDTFAVHYRNGSNSQLLR